MFPAFIVSSAGRDHSGGLVVIHLVGRDHDETHQGEIGLVIEDEYFPITTFGEE